MYQYNAKDRQIVAERVTQYRDQTRRFLTGELDGDQFRPLRLQNGLYFEKHNPMLRIAIPYGQISSRQLRTLARITRTYDRGYGHFTTRTNLQLNWVRTDQVPEILAELAKVDMNAIQSSGSCIRVTTTDPLAGVAPTEVADPRPWAEIFRQWSTLHPEFAALPRILSAIKAGRARSWRPWGRMKVSRLIELAQQALRGCIGDAGMHEMTYQKRLHIQILHALISI